MMPCDVSMRWNSTFDMLSFAIDYQKALVKIAGEMGMNLHMYELNKNEWKLAGQLCEALKVRFFIYFIDSLTNALVDLQGCDAFLLP